MDFATSYVVLQTTERRHEVVNSVAPSFLFLENRIGCVCYENAANRLRFSSAPLNYSN